MLCLDQQLCLPERETLNDVTYSMSVWCPFFITCCKIAALLPPKTSNFALHKLIQCLDNKCKWPSCCLSYAKHSRSVYPSYNTSTFRWVLPPPGWFAVTASANTEVFFMQMRLKDQLVRCYVCVRVCTVRGRVCYRESFNPIRHATYCDSGCSRPQLWFCSRKDNYFTFHLKFIIRGRERQVNDR